MVECLWYKFHLATWAFSNKLAQIIFYAGWILKNEFRIEAVRLAF